MRLTSGQQLKVLIKVWFLQSTRGWSWAHVKKISRDILYETDTTTIRVILANASLLWAFALWTNPHVFQLPSYEVMRAVGSASFWEIVFLMHFLGVYWRTFTPKSSVGWGLVVNGYGFMIWFFTTVSLNFYLGGLSPGTSLELVMCSASAWALYKTGFKPEAVSP